jgi:DNA-binding transcriptional MerR regulator
MDNFLRNECKYLKCYQGISYKEIAEYLEIKQDSFYSWLKGHYNFSIERKAELKRIISTLKEV